ncbi:MAG: hypothetical protein FJ088_01690 [Deltaproteobacteria bacterium]|nr:hypothetical protein [Deltaproteobacteria bacterium]
MGSNKPVVSICMSVLLNLSLTEGLLADFKMAKTYEVEFNEFASFVSDSTISLLLVLPEEELKSVEFLSEEIWLVPPDGDPFLAFSYPAGAPGASFEGENFKESGFMYYHVPKFSYGFDINVVFVATDSSGQLVNFVFFFPEEMIDFLPYNLVEKKDSVAETVNGTLVSAQKEFQKQVNKEEAKWIGLSPEAKAEKYQDFKAKFFKPFDK